MAYLPGPAMPRIAKPHAACHTLPSLKLADSRVAELTLLSGFDKDLADQIVGVCNDRRGLLTQIRPRWEHIVGPHLDHPAMRDLLERYLSPAQLAALSQQLTNRLIKLASRLGKIWAADMVQTFSEQTFVVLHSDCQLPPATPSAGAGGAAYPSRRGGEGS